MNARPRHARLPLPLPAQSILFLLATMFLLPAGEARAEGKPTLLRETIRLTEMVCTLDLQPDGPLEVCAGETFTLRALLSCASGYVQVAEPQWFLDGIPAGTGETLLLSVLEGTHICVVTCGACEDEVTIVAAACPDKPRLDASYSNDAAERDPGIFLQPNLGPVFSFNFEALKHLMRPFTLRPPETSFEGTFRLESTGDQVVEAFTLDGLALPLPAEFQAHDAPMEFLVNAIRCGTDTLRVTFTPDAPGNPPESDEVVIRVELFPGLSGRELDGSPHFLFVDSYNARGRLQSGLDPQRHPERAGRPYDVHVVPHRSPQQWAADNTLQDVTGLVESSVLSGSSVGGNILTIWENGLDPGEGVGEPYDIIYDFGRDGRLDPGDLIDGFAWTGGGCYVLGDLVQAGPHAVEQGNHVGGDWYIERVYYPAGIGSLGLVPLIIISHGNGHRYDWYDYLGVHLASYGYVVMSHINNTSPGSEAAAQTTFSNTDYFLGHLDEIAGGVLQGHVDGHRIGWIGHSIGGEGVVRAYDRLYDGEWSAQQYTWRDIVLLSGIAPAVGLQADFSDPHESNYHLIVGGADGDIGSFPSCAGCQCLRLPDRGRGIVQTTYVHGADHNDFNCCGREDAQGPDLIGREEAQRIARAYYVALAETYTRGNLATKEYLTRMYDDFHPDGIDPEVEIATTYRELNIPANYVIDDFQSMFQINRSSSGGGVSGNVQNLVEGPADDADSVYAWTGVDRMNGMTMNSGNGDFSRAAMFDHSEGLARHLLFEIIQPYRDLRQHRYLSFRACQGTRHPETVALNGPHSFSATLCDGAGRCATVPFGAWGELTFPYQRDGWGPGAGWVNEMNTVRIPLALFTADGSGIDLSDIRGVRFDFGSGFGSPRGRIGLDDIQFMKN